MAWQCLLLISTRLNDVAPDQCSLADETQENITLIRYDIMTIHTTDQSNTAAFLWELGV